MKTIAMFTVISLLSTMAVACGNGCTEYQGLCACEAPGDTSKFQEVQPSNEKPRREQQPAWQTGEIKADTPPPFHTEAEEADAQIKWAQKHQGTGL